MDLNAGRMAEARALRGERLGRFLRQSKGFLVPRNHAVVLSASKQGDPIVVDARGALADSPAVEPVAHQVRAEMMAYERWRCRQSIGGVQIDPIKFNAEQIQRSLIIQSLAADRRDLYTADGYL